jgi:hypothetical protein
MLAQAAAKKSWKNRDLPNWRDRVGDLLKGEQILVKNLKEVNALFVAARRKGTKESRHAAANFQMRNPRSLQKVFTIARLNLLQPEM